MIELMKELRDAAEAARTACARRSLKLKIPNPDDCPHCERLVSICRRIDGALATLEPPEGAAPMTDDQVGPAILGLIREHRAHRCPVGSCAVCLPAVLAHIWVGGVVLGRKHEREARR